MPENVSHTINSFLSIKAALIEAQKIGADSIVFPGMGTGTGGMLAEDCAKQTSAAIKYVLIDKRAEEGPKSLYEEQDYIRKYVVSEKWYKVQSIQ
jgi:O-acetyl-ADP-ribose deacetylase (regulator of RNase III)